MAALVGLVQRSSLYLCVSWLFRSGPIHPAPSICQVLPLAKNAGAKRVVLSQADVTQTAGNPANPKDGNFISLQRLDRLANRTTQAALGDLGFLHCALAESSGSARHSPIQTRRSHVAKRPSSAPVHDVIDDSPLGAKTVRRVFRISIAK